jgi:hypothetical protein
MPNWKKIIVSGSDAPLNSVEFNTSPSPTPTTQGSVYWNEDDLALSAILNGYIMTIGEDQFYPVKNQTGSNISKGTAVQFAGTLGMSGRLLIQPFLADGSVQSSFFMGVTAEDINNGEDGKVLWFGRIKEINTNAFEEGDTLYASTTTPGGFQTTVPQAPNNIIQVAAVITKSTTVGTIFVRPTLGSNINKDEGVKITSPSTNDILQLQSNGLWENKTLSQAGIQPTLTNPITGTGTTNYISKFTGTNTQGNSIIFDNGTNVGIGTTSPNAKLQVDGSIRTRGGETITGSLLITNANTGQSSFIWMDSSDRMRIDNAVTSGRDVIINGDGTGRVGIGTTSPTGKLDVNGSTTSTQLGVGAAPSGTTRLDVRAQGALSTDQIFKIRNSADNRDVIRVTGDENMLFGSDNQNVTCVKSTSFHSGFYQGTNLRYFGSGDPLTNTTYIGGVGGNVRGGTLLFTRANSNTLRGLYFYTAPASTGADDAATLTEQFRVTPNEGYFRGNLGIGTTSPTGKLEINSSTTNVFSTVGSFSNVMFGGTNGVNADGNGVWSFVNNGTGPGTRLFVQDANNLSDRLTFDFRGNNGSNLILAGTSTGNVGVGTTSPSEKLDVDGKARIRTIDNATGNFLTTSATGVVQQRTPAQVLTDTDLFEVLPNSGDLQTIILKVCRLDTAALFRKYTGTIKGYRRSGNTTSLDIRLNVSDSSTAGLISYGLEFNRIQSGTVESIEFDYSGNKWFGLKITVGSAFQLLASLRFLNENKEAGIDFEILDPATITNELPYTSTHVYSKNIAGNVGIMGSLVVTGSVAGAVQTLSIVSSTASLDLSRGNFFELTLESGSVTHLSPTNIQLGQTINLKITQPATSGSLTYGSEFKFPGGIPYSASATGSVTDIVSLISFDSTTLYATAIKNLS